MKPGDVVIYNSGFMQHSVEAKVLQVTDKEVSLVLSAGVYVTLTPEDAERLCKKSC